MADQPVANGGPALSAAVQTFLLDLMPLHVSRTILAKPSDLEIELREVLRRSGEREEDAERLAQEFIEWLLEGDYLRAVRLSLDGIKEEWVYILGANERIRPGDVHSPLL